MSELLKKPCSCGGNNPNCYICGGWGYIDSVSESRIPTGQGEAFVKINKVSRKRKSLSDDEIVKRILASDKKTIKQKSNKVIAKLEERFPKDIKSTLKKQVCNICGKEIKDNTEHIPCLFDKKNLVKQNKTKKTINAKIHRIKEIKKNCLFCGQSIFKNIIDAHIERVHSNSSIKEQEKIRIALSLLFINLS
ncbi:hypothetical protein RHO12_03315 [Orbus sturtevantii]|uniref:hypothetical protein n=1 Tax=Orbus sturtevantii TaxID=3074109 RepID=UPI00370D77AA